MSNPHKPLVFIVDDVATIGKVITIYLQSDYDCRWFDNPIHALDALQSGEYPDLIISDVRMPDMRGDELLDCLKSNELFRNIPVVMLSSEDSTTERIRLLNNGAEDYIVKPFNPLELKVRIQKILK